MRQAFRVFAHRTAEWVGSPSAFVLGCALIVLWAVAGPAFGYSDTWQLGVNTATTIVTFLMVFLIQNTQNRDARAIHLKLDELLPRDEGRSHGHGRARELHRRGAGPPPGRARSAASTARGPGGCTSG
jgi:low affinity Fe/Cu permease